MEDNDVAANKPDEDHMDNEIFEYGGEELGEARFVHRPLIRVRYPSEYAETEDDCKYGLLREENETEGADEASLWTGHPGYSPSVLSLVESDETEEDKSTRLLREVKLDELKQKLTQRQNLKRRNMFLQKKLVEHFKKRRMEHVLQEDTKGLDQDSKYLRKLFSFQEFKNTLEEEMANVTKKMSDYKEQTDQLETELKNTLQEFIKRQKEVSVPLILTKSGRVISAKMVEKQLTNQMQKFDELGLKRYKFIKIKNLIEDKEKELYTLEHIGDGLHMMDYEQSKLDNLNYSDKIEEREAELGKLRVKTKCTIQYLAQVREKACAVEYENKTMTIAARSSQEELEEIRERLAIMKKQRDHLRNEYVMLKHHSGLLTKDLLLRDFQESIEEADATAIQLEHLQLKVLDRNVKFHKLIKMNEKKTSYANVMFPIEVQLEPKLLTSKKNGNEVK